MRVIRALVAAFATYSRIPMPMVSLDNDDTRYSMAIFPLVGAIIGALEYLWYWICTRLGIPDIARVILMAFIPFMITGGIHLDGFVDCMDAIHCFGGVEKRLEILKDPHIGAFSVLKLVQFGLLYLFCAYMIGPSEIPAFCASFVISRILSAFGVTYYKSAKKKGMLASTKDVTRKKTVTVILVIELIVIIGLFLWGGLIQGACCIVASGLCMLWYHHASARDFGGVTGDTAGCFLCMTELAQIFVLTLLVFARMIFF